MLLIDAIVVKVRDAQVANRPVCVAIGVDPAGERDVLGLWLGPTGGEGAKAWATMLTELRNRGLADALIVCCDGLRRTATRQPAKPHRAGGSRLIAVRTCHLAQLVQSALEADPRLPCAPPTGAGGMPARDSSRAGVRRMGETPRRGRRSGSARLASEPRPERPVHPATTSGRPTVAAPPLTWAFALPGEKNVPGSREIRSKALSRQAPDLGVCNSRIPLPGPVWLASRATAPGRPGAPGSGGRWRAAAPGPARRGSPGP